VIQNAESVVLIVKSYQVIELLSYLQDTSEYKHLMPIVNCCLPASSYLEFLIGLVVNLSPREVLKVKSPKVF
jgi:hypothetical protein